MPAPSGIRPGDPVKVRMEIPGPVRSAVVLFLVPAGWLIAGIVFWQGVLSNGQGAKSDIIGLLLGVVLMAIWYVGFALVDRRLHRGRPGPRLAEWPQR